MNIFLTKVWGFGEPCGPLQFSMAGLRDSARNMLSDEDLVILVGTKGGETKEEEQGRLLGIMEPTREVVSCLDFNLTRSDHDYNEAGEYKWPYGLLIRRAWLFEDPKPLLTEVTQRNFGMAAATGLVPLLADEAIRVMEFPRREIQILAPTRVRARLKGEEAARKKNAPPPTTTRHGVMHMRRAPAHTYLMRIEGATSISFKIGWAFDYKQRQRQFNLYALPKLGGVSYKTVLFHLWDTAADAFLMEQAVLGALNSYRHSHNSEVVSGLSQEHIVKLWGDCLFAKTRKKKD